MDSLLKIAIDAHGGLNAWNQFENLRASVSIGGALWEQKQLPGLFNNSRIDLKLRQQQVITDLPDIGERIVFTPGEVSLESNSGTRLDARIEPRSSFAGQSADSKWDKLHAGFSAATRYGDTSPRRFSIHIRDSRQERLSLGTRTESVGVCWR